MSKSVRKTVIRIPAGPATKNKSSRMIVGTFPAEKEEEVNQAPAVMPVPTMNSVAHKANWTSMFEWLDHNLKERSEAGAVSFSVNQDVWTRADLDLHEVQTYLVEHLGECMSLPMKHATFPEPLATYIAGLHAADELSVTWQPTSLQAWSILFSWEAPDAVPRPELIEMARLAGGFVGDAEARMLARSVQQRRPPLSLKEQEDAVRALAADAARVTHEAMWQQMREWIKQRVAQHKAAAVNVADRTLIVPDSVWQRNDLGLHEATGAIAAAAERGEWNGQLEIEPLRAFIVEHGLTMRYTIEPSQLKDDEKDEPVKWIISFSW